MIDRTVERYSDVEDQQVCWVGRGQSFAQTTSQRVAKLARTRACNAGIGNEKKLWIDLAREVCRVRVFVPG